MTAKSYVSEAATAAKRLAPEEHDILIYCCLRSVALSSPNGSHSFSRSRCRSSLLQAHRLGGRHRREFSYELPRECRRIIGGV